MMDPGEDRIIADAIYEGSPSPVTTTGPVIPRAPVQVQGQWSVAIQYSRGIGEQRFTLEQSGNDLTGVQQASSTKPF